MSSPILQHGGRGEGVQNLSFRRQPYNRQYRRRGEHTIRQALHNTSIAVIARLLAENYPSLKFEVENKGIYGELVCGGMSYRLPKVLKEYGPYDIVIILGGTNDIIEPKEGLEDTLFEQIKMLHSEVKGHGSKCVALTIPETDVYFKDLGKNGLSWVKEAGDNIRLKLNGKLRAYIKDCGGEIILCDLAEKFPQQSLSAESLEKLWSDGLHFTEDGYNKMAEIIYEDMRYLVS